MWTIHRKAEKGMKGSARTLNGTNLVFKFMKDLQSIFKRPLSLMCQQCFSRILGHLH